MAAMHARASLMALLLLVTCGMTPVRGLASAMVQVTSPPYCSTVQGDTPIVIAAAGFRTVTVRCWKQGEGFGADSAVGQVALDGQGQGTIVFPADEFPHGPITLTITGQSRDAKDNCYLQLYNQGGVSWNEGLPEDPCQAAGMKLVFADDFNEPLSISSTDPNATYYDHKPPNGWQDFSVHTFTSHGSRKSPFAHIDSYLRIRASDKAHSSGLICSIKNDGSGITASAPCYFECRFLGPNAIGTWPAFWLMTNYMAIYEPLRDKTPCDELDIIEAYGGEGPKSPNAGDALHGRPALLEPGRRRQSHREKGIRRTPQPNPHAQVRHPLDLVRGVSHLRLQNHRNRHDLLLRQHRGRPPPDPSAI